MTPSPATSSSAKPKGALAVSLEGVGGSSPLYLPVILNSGQLVCWRPLALFHPCLELLPVGGGQTLAPQGLWAPQRVPRF